MSTTVVTSTFDKLQASMAALRKQGEQSKKAAEYFKTVTTLNLVLRGNIRVKETEALGRFEFKTKVQNPDGSTAWQKAEANCQERRMQIFKWADVLDMSGPEPVVVDSVLVALNIRTYHDSRGECIGLSPKNSRFNRDILTGHDILRAHGHVNDWERTDSRTGQKEKIKIFNVNGIGKFEKPSEFARRQKDELALASIPDMGDMADLPADDAQ